MALVSWTALCDSLLHVTFSGKNTVEPLYSGKAAAELTGHCRRLSFNKCIRNMDWCSVGAK